MWRHTYDYIKKHKALLFLIIPAFILHMIVMMPSGTNMCIGERCGIHFWGVHSFDAVWHLQIAGASFKTFPFIVPTFAGEILSGYNILMDLILYGLSLIGLSPTFTLFKIIPLIWFFFYTWGLIHLARKIRDSVLFVGLMLFFGYFAGHLGYILQLYHDGSILKGTQSFSLQSLTTQLNTQFALTLPMILWMLSLLRSKAVTLKYTIIMGILAFLVMGLKFYGGVVSIVIAGFFIIETYLQKRSLMFFLQQSLIIGIFVLASILLFYNPFEATQSGSVLIWAPFSTVHSMIEEPNMVYMPDMVNARYFLYEQGLSPRLFYIEMLSAALYIFFNFGTRVFGILYMLIKGTMRKLERFDVYVFLTTFIATALTILLIQKGDWWNTVQFSYYGIFLANILAAQFLYDLLKKKNILLYGLAGVILFFTIPQNISTIAAFTRADVPYIPRAELEAMKVLKKEPYGTVFTSFPKDYTSDYPFESYENTGYVAAYTGKPVYLAHLGPLTIIGLEEKAKKRNERIKAMDCKVLTENDYLYFVKKHKIDYLLKCEDVVKESFKELFENDLVKIYKKN